MRGVTSQYSIKHDGSRLPGNRSGTLKFPSEVLAGRARSAASADSHRPPPTSHLGPCKTSRLRRFMFGTGKSAFGGLLVGLFVRMSRSLRSHGKCSRDLLHTRSCHKRSMAQLPRRAPFRNPRPSRAATSRTLFLPLLPPPSLGGASRGRAAPPARTEPLPPARQRGGERIPGICLSFSFFPSPLGAPAAPGSARDFYRQVNSGLLALEERPHTWAPVQPLSPREVAEPQDCSCQGSQSPRPQFVFASGVYSQWLPRLPAPRAPRERCGKGCGRWCGGFLRL